VRLPLSIPSHLRILHHPLEFEVACLQDRFCSNCGKEIAAVRGSTVLLIHYCRACAPRYQRRRAMFAVVLALLAVLSFETARWTTRGKTVHLISTPIERLSNSENDAQADDSSANNRNRNSGPGISPPLRPARSAP